MDGYLVSWVRYRNQCCPSVGRMVESEEQSPTIRYYQEWIIGSYYPVLVLLLPTRTRCTLYHCRKERVKLDILLRQRYWEGLWREGIALTTQTRKATAGSVPCWGTGISAPAFSARNCRLYCARLRQKPAELFQGKRCFVLFINLSLASFTHSSQHPASNWTAPHYPLASRRLSAGANY